MRNCIIQPLIHFTLCSYTNKQQTSTVYQLNTYEIGPIWVNIAVMQYWINFL